MAGPVGPGCGGRADNSALVSAAGADCVSRQPAGSVAIGIARFGIALLSSRLSALLVAGEVALSALLLVGSGLLFHTLWNLERARLGFDTARLTTFTATPADTAGFFATGLPSGNGPAPASAYKLVYQPVLDGLRAIPGVESATIATAPPLSGIGFHAAPVSLANRSAPRCRERVSPAWRATMAAPCALRWLRDG